MTRVHCALGNRLTGKIVAASDIVPLLESIIEPGDRVCLEGNNQKQADFLAQAMVRLDSGKVPRRLSLVRGSGRVDPCALALSGILAPDACSG